MGATATKEEAVFDRKAVRRWRRDVWRAFESVGFKGPQISAAMVLAAVDAIGTDLDALSTLTGLSHEYCRKVVRRLRQQRILRGQTMRVAWDREDCGWLAPALDALVATGELTRPVDEKRSSAQKKRAPDTFATGPRRRAATIVGPFTPTHQKSNPLYGLPEWEKPGVRG